MKGRGGVNDKGGVNGRCGRGVSLTGASEEDGTLCSSLASEKESGLFHHWNDVQIKAGRAKTTAVEALGGLNEVACVLDGPWTLVSSLH